ncbi:hypothetical protein BDN70DRAFT_871158 [Pholiota conissans]|uniref:Uncharacterized protein n=1 Tax=Pholiota conissans TaxID=109636 RepID=A0A9P5ZDL4_9AGAR|nr:hypothetical protein BDN70DRAFT_871158 [Pholiota conissans]
MRTQLGVNEQTTPLLPTGPDGPDSTRLPQAPPTTAGSRPRTTRNGTAAVADADAESNDDEPPPILVPDSDRRRSSRPGHESDTSMPDLQAVSDSSDGEDVDDDDESGWVDDESDDGRRDAGRLRSNGDFDGDPVAAFFRDIMGADLAGFPGFRPPTQNQAPQARPNRSARFSTVVDRSGSDRSTANRNGNRNTNEDANHGNGSAGTDQPMRLMEWAEAVLRMNRELDSDDDASMPALEPVPRSRNRQADSDDDEPMPALEPIPLPRSTIPHEDSDDEAMPALEPIPPPTAPLPVVSVATSSRSDQQDAPCAQPDPQPFTMGSGLMLSSANAPASQSLLSETGPVRAGAAEENAPGISIRKTERKTFNQQDFTTDGRGRVISIGGPEPSILVAPTAPEHSEIHAVSAEVVEEAQQLPTPAAIQRKSSEFTTDGRGRVISVGHSVSSESSVMAESSALGESESNTESVANRREEARDGDESGNGGGLLAWFGALF